MKCENCDNHPWKEKRGGRFLIAAGSGLRCSPCAWNLEIVTTKPSKKKGETFRLRFGNPVLLSVSRMWRKGVLQKGGLLRPIFDKQKERSLHLTDPPRQSWSNLEQSIDGEQGTHIVQDSQPRSLVRDVNELVAKWQLRSLKIRRCKRRLRDSKAIEMQV